MPADTSRRRPLYAKIALARKQLPNMDEEAYRDLLEHEFSVRSAKDLNFHQLARLLDVFAGLGASFTPQKPAKQKPHVRSDYYHIADDEFGPLKRKICAIWRNSLGYDMTSLDMRVKREFGAESFAWLRDKNALKRLVTDLEKREKSKRAVEWAKATEAEIR